MASRSDFFVRGGFDITPDDDNDLEQDAVGLYVGTSGTVKVTYENGDVQDYPSLAAGVWHPMAVRRVWATGTTATGIRGGK